MPDVRIYIAKLLRDFPPILYIEVYCSVDGEIAIIQIASVMASHFSLFSSLRYDPQLRQAREKGLDYAGWNYENTSPFSMLNYHRDRILRAAAHWGWQRTVDVLSGAEGLQSLERLALEYVGSSQTAPLRLRIIIDDQAHISFAKFDTLQLPLENVFPKRLPPPGQNLAENDPKREPHFRLVADDAGTARSEYTHFKTTNRGMYDDARQRAGIEWGQLKEVLIVNEKDGSVMEGSVTTPYFWRGGRWVTPPVSNKFSREVGSGGQDGTTRRWALERSVLRFSFVLYLYIIIVRVC
jgi:4-amino-4-deoxychorismate lyase